MNNQADSLDYEIVESDDGERKFHVWTPDVRCGAVIGSGPTRNAAIKNAISNLTLTATRLVDELRWPPQ